MVRTREQRRVEAAEEAGLSMTALPDDLLLRVLEHAMVEWDWRGVAWKMWRWDVRGVSRRWRAPKRHAAPGLSLRRT